MSDSAVIAGVVVGVFRKCRRCLVWRKLGNFNRNRKVCDECCLRRYRNPAGQVPARGIVITESGRAAWRAEASTIEATQDKGPRPLEWPGPAAQEM